MVHIRHGFGYVLAGVMAFTWATGLALADAPTIHDVLPKDAIRAILKPEFVPASEARVEPETAMIGVVLGGEAHAYATVVLNSHEIVNDVVGGVKVATTW